MGRTYATSVKLLLLLLLALNLEAARVKRAHSGGLRRKIHVADVITAPGTIEVEWYNTFSTTGNYWMPTLLKATPWTSDNLLGRTEFSVGFDAIDSQEALHSSDHVTLSTLSVLTSGNKFSFAAGPIVNFSTRGDEGIHAGALGLARWDLGAHNFGVTGSWNGVLDVGGGYGVDIGRFSPHLSVQWERPKSGHGYYSVTEGVAFQLRKNLTLDLVGQQLGSPTGPTDNQVQCGLIYNFGKIRRH